MTTHSLILLATEGGIPTSNPWSQLAVPLGILIFVGSVYMLIRSNLGTRRGYLVMSVSLWGFAFLLSLVWTFGAPGTPPTTGPQNLPGQELDAYQPVWRPFAADSTLATDETSPYSQAAAAFPDGWGPVPADFTARAETGVINTTSFFSGLATAEDVEADTYRNVLFGTETQMGDTQYAVADDGRPMIAITMVTTCQLIDDPAAPEDEEMPEQVLPPNCAAAGLDVGEPAPEETTGEDGDVVREEQTLFAFFDAGAPYFPSLLMNGILLVLFAVHLLLLARDETRERKEVQAAQVEAVEAEEKATVSV